MIHIEHCPSKCRGQSCCNCCGEAPAMHRCGREFIPFQLYDPKCCEKTRWTNPGGCMFLCGKTRHEWMNEAIEKEKEDDHE